MVDIIHTQTEFGLGLAGKLIAAMLKIPTIHTYHTMYEKYLLCCKEKWRISQHFVIKQIIQVQMTKR